MLRHKTKPYAELMSRVDAGLPYHKDEVFGAKTRAKVTAEKCRQPLLDLEGEWAHQMFVHINKP